MTVEERLSDAFHGADDYQPSPDLFAKVQRSIAEDQAHRRRVVRLVAIFGSLTLGTAVVLALLWDRVPGRNPLPWWAVVVVLYMVMAAVIVGVGPMIRRFGHSYVEGVFRTHPATGPKFLWLLDVSYYLVFVAYALFFVPFRADPLWQFGNAALARMLGEAAFVVGGLLLLMGVLHAVTIFALPFLGLVFAVTRHRALVGEPKEARSPEVRRAHRTVTVVLIVIAALVGWQLLGLIAGLVIGVAGSLAG